MNSKKRILLVASVASSLKNFRGDLITTLLDAGYEVYTAAPETTPEIHQILLDLGVTPLYFRLQRTGLNPLKDIRTLWAIRKILKQHRIDLIIPYTIKPVIYSSLAARALKIPVISMITGLGFTFSKSSAKAERLQKITQTLYRFSLRKNEVVIFQNTDDLALFRKLNLLRPTQETAVVNGSGVNLTRYPYRANSVQEAVVKFAMVARLIREKGIHLYIEAATRLKQHYPGAEFHVIGAPGDSISSIEPDRLSDLHARGIIHYHGSSNRVPALLAECDVFVLPTFYREGIPRSILEALSVGLPIITTETPGCKETVVPGSNGFLIPPQDAEALEKAMAFFLEQPEKVGPMGAASRAMAEKKFDVRLINRDLLEIVSRVLAPGIPQARQAYES